MLGGFVVLALVISAAVIRWRDVVGNT